MKIINRIKLIIVIAIQLFFGASNCFAIKTIIVKQRGLVCLSRESMERQVILFSKGEQETLTKDCYLAKKDFEAYELWNEGMIHTVVTTETVDKEPVQLFVHQISIK